MKKKILIPVIILVSILLIFGGIKLYSYLRIKYAKVEVELVSDLTLEFNDKKKVSDYIESINGKIVNDYTIDSSKLGKKTIDFKFINDDNIKLNYSFDVNVVDTVILDGDKYVLFSLAICNHMTKKGESMIIQKDDNCLICKRCKAKFIIKEEN